MKKRSELLFLILHLPIDYFMIVAGFTLAYLLREGQAKPLAYLVGGKQYLAYLLVFVPIWIVIYALFGLYSINSANRSRFNEFSRTIGASAVATTVLIIIDFFLTTPIFPSKAVPIYGFLLATILVCTARYMLFLLQKFLYKYKFGVHNTLVLGSGADRIELEKLLKEKSLGYNIVANNTTKSFLSQTDLDNFQISHKLDDIFYVDSKEDSQIIAKLMLFCRKNQVQLHIVPTINELYGATMRSARIGDLALLEIISTPLDGWGRVVKRIMDLFLASLCMIVALPLILVIAVLVKLTDPGPVFYIHERLTRSGKKVRIYKIRTMQLKYCTGGKYSGMSDLEALKTFNNPALVEEFRRDQKVKKDPRVKAFGRFLRSSSLDELPQLFNVLKSELSFVGPRPIVEKELERYGDESGMFLHVKPGLTGLWQVSGRNDLGYDDRVKLDIYYVENWSLSLDVSILIKTIPALLWRKNGY